MGELDFVDNFRDLLVYKKSRAISREIFTLTKSFPKEETYSLTDQIRRSSWSVGEQLETQHWLGVALDCEYISLAQTKDLVEKCAEIGRMLGGMMSKADSFCSPKSLSIHDEQAAYNTD